MPALFRHFAYGLLMGGADIIPGVSGGTMALVVGIYERLVGAISALFRGVVLLLRGKGLDGFAAIRKVEWGLILPLGAGIATAIVLASIVITHLLEAYPAQCNGLFLGLVLASIAIPALRVSRWTAGAYALAAAAAVAAFWLTGLPAGAARDPSYLRVFLSAAVAICAMILPGISGAFLLKAMGLYETTLGALKALDVAYVGVFLLGVAVGLGLFSGVLSFLLRRYHDLTMAALVGLMAGALRALWPWQHADRALHLPTAADPVVSVAVLFVLGFVAIALLVRVEARRLEKQVV